MTGSEAMSHAQHISDLRNRDWHEHRDREAALDVETTRCDTSGAHVRVSGELDMATSAPLWAVLQSHLAAGRRFLRLDLSGVTFLDASALNAIARVHSDALSLRGTLVITGVRAPAARVMQMTGLDRVLFISGPRAGGFDDLPSQVALSSQVTDSYRFDDGDAVVPATWTAAS